MQDEVLTASEISAANYAEPSKTIYQRDGFCYNKTGLGKRVEDCEKGTFCNSGIYGASGQAPAVLLSARKLLWPCADLQCDLQL